MLSEQVQKRERLKLEQTKKQKAYLEMIFFPLEHVIRPILNQFMEIDRKKLFLNHVTMDEAADYHSIIKQPMCFSEIYQKLVNHSYATLDHFKNDVQLIWRNSMDYNTSDTSFYKVASKLKNASQKLFDHAEAKLSRFEILQDGMLSEEIDDAIFTYDASFDEDDFIDLEEKHPIVVIDTEAEARLKLEKERLKTEKEAEHQRAIRARVEGRAKARALREENKRKGILPAVNPVEEKIKSKTLRKLRNRGNPALTGVASNSACTMPDQDPTLISANDSFETSPSPLLSNANDNTQLSLIERTIGKHEELEQPVKHTAEQVNNLKIEQPVNSSALLTPSNSLITNVLPLSATTSDDSVDAPIKDILVDHDFEAAEEAQEQKDTTSTPVKRKRSSQHVTPRLTRSNGLKASIEELTKRRKISQEARALYASYNGVSHLDRPLEVYKENRKKHAPIGWVWLEDDEDNEEEEEEENDEKREESMDIDESLSAEAGSSKRQVRLGRNDIPVPEFNKGEIVWARVNKYPSHPAKVRLGQFALVYTNADMPF